MPLVNKKRADFLFWKIYSTAFLSNGITAQLTQTTTSNRVARIFIMMKTINLNNIILYLNSNNVI